MSMRKLHLLSIYSARIREVKLSHLCLTTSMTGKRYYFTTLGAWRRHAARCAETHFVAIRARTKGAGLDPAAAETTATDKCDATSFERTQAEACATEDATQILALVDADEGAHLAMENDAEFDTL